MQDVKFRLVNPALAPRRTKIEMPGWAGQPKPRADGSHEYAWHCAPSPKARNTASRFSIRTRTSCASLSGTENGFSTAISDPTPKATCSCRHSAASAMNITLYQLLLDLKVGTEWAVRTEPHPRFYTDTTGTVPIAVPALLRTEWWPMISFIVFKAPMEGQAHISGRGNRCCSFWCCQ